MVYSPPAYAQLKTFYTSQSASKSPKQNRKIVSNISEKKEHTPESVLTYFENEMLSMGWFSYSDIPPAFLNISKLIKSQNHDAVKQEVKNLLEYFESLFTSSVQAKFVDKDKMLVGKSLQSIAVLAKYISHFYIIKFDENGIFEEDKFKPRTLNISHLIQCFDDLKKFEDIKNGLTFGDSSALPELQGKEAPLNSDKAALFPTNRENELNDVSGLAQGGIDAKDFIQRIFSQETAATLAFCTSADGGAAYAGTKDIASSVFLAGLVTIVGQVGMIAAFAPMCMSDTGIGYKEKLQKMLLDDVYSCLSEQQKNTPGFMLNNLTHNTRSELVEYLDLTPQELLALGFKKRIIYGKLSIPDPETNLISENDAISPAYSSVDVADFYKDILSEKDEIKYENIKIKLKELTEGNRRICLDALRTKVTKIYTKNEGISNRLFGRYGTILDHLFSKLTDADKITLLKDLSNGEEIFGCAFKNPNLINVEIDKEIASNSTPDPLGRAVAHIYTIMKTKSWEDRHGGAQEFSKLMFDIYSCKLNQNDKFFLMQRIVESLQEGFHGEFAKAKTKRQNAARLALISSLYSFTTVASYILGVTGASDLYKLITILTDGLAATAFGFLGYAPYMNVMGSFDNTCAHNSMLDTVQKALQAEGIINQIEIDQISLKPESKGLKEKYFRFMDTLKKLKDLKGKSIENIERTEWEGYLREIKDFIVYFNENGITEFVFESNHGSRNCPLFDIIEIILDAKILNKITGSEKELKEFALKEVNKILELLYEEKINLELKKENSGFLIKNMTPDIFRTYVSTGIAQTSEKSSKDLLIFSLQCSTLLNSMKYGPNKCPDDIYNECEYFVFDAIKTAASEKGSIFYDLQKRNVKTYMKRKVIARFFVNLSTSGFFSLYVILTGCPLTTPLALIAAAIIATFDYTFRKLCERMEYSTRITFGDTVLFKAHRHYEILRSIVDITEEVKLAHESDELNLNSNKISAKNVLKNVSHMQKTGLTQELIISEFEKCMTDLQIKADDIKITNIKALSAEEKIGELRKEIALLFKQGMDKNSINILLVRIQRLILSSNVSKNERRILLNEAAIYGCFLSPLAKILQTKNTLGSMQYLLADIALGLATHMFNIPKAWSAWAGNASIFDSPDFTTQCGVGFTQDFVSLWGWVLALDVSMKGKTKSFQGALGSFKLCLALDSNEEIGNEYKEKIDILNQNLVEAQKEGIEKRKLELKKIYKSAALATPTLFKIQRSAFYLPFTDTKSSRNCIIDDKIFESDYSFSELNTQII